MTALVAWLTDFLVKFLTPLVEKLISNTIVAKKVSAIEEKHDALIKAVVGTLQNAKTPQEMQDAIKAIAAADNAGS